MRAYFQRKKPPMAGNRHIRCTATTTKGRRCQCVPLPLNVVCVRHLPMEDKRRQDFFADQAKRTRSYWAKRREAKEA
jgi:hypothetical protein